MVLVLALAIPAGASLDRREVAQQAALLMQDSPLDVPLSAREVVALGRLPYLRRFETVREAGSPAEALTEENLARLWGVSVRVDIDEDGLLRVVPSEPLDAELRR